MFKFFNLAILVGFLVACNSKKNENTLILLTSADNPPYQFIDSRNGKIDGFEIELAREIARRMKMDLEINDTPFSTLIVGLRSGKGDVAMSTISKTEEREKEVDFSNSYHEAIPTLISKEKIDAKSYQDLKGKRVGVQLGSVYDIAFKNLVLEDPEFKITVVSLGLTGEILQELKKGKIDCMIVDGIVAQNYSKQGFVAIPLIEQKVDSYSAAFPKGSIIFNKFNEVLENLKKEGFVDRLTQKWLLEAPSKLASR